MPTAIRVHDLHKRFAPRARGATAGGDGEALNGIDLHVEAGTVAGLLGPNGAGKTTAVRILTTLLRADAGTAEVAGFDVRREPAAVRDHIGLVGQHAALDEILSGRQNLVLFGRLQHLGAGRARRRADELLERFDLTDAADRPVAQYSGGMRRRLDLAAGLLIAPAVLFLDEPTTGLDPRGRAEVWRAVRTLVGTGTTVLLTTQYLEEADQLADRVTVLDSGRVVAAGTPGELKADLGADRVEVVVHDVREIGRAAAALGSATGAEPEVDADRRLVRGPIGERSGALVDVLRALDAAGIEVEDITRRRPTLDEVFLHLTGSGRGVAA